MIVLYILLDVLACQYVIHSARVLKHEIYHFTEKEPMNLFRKSKLNY